jgi:hypothetical protein
MTSRRIRWILACSVGLCVGLVRADGTTLGPVVGAVDHATATVWIRHTGKSPLKLTVRKPGGAS